MLISGQHWDGARIAQSVQWLGYWRDDPGFESRQGYTFLFPKTSTPTLWLKSSPIQWVPGLFPWGKTAGAWKLTIQFHLVSTLRMTGAIPLLRLYAFIVRTRKTSLLPLTSLLRGFIPVLQFPLSVSFHQWSILTFIYMFLLPQGQMLEAWEPSKKQWSFRNQGQLHIKVLSLSRLIA
jgi:hypothetical protein